MKRKYFNIDSTKCEGIKVILCLGINGKVYYHPIWIGRVYLTKKLLEKYNIDILKIYDCSGHMRYVDVNFMYMLKTEKQFLDKLEITLEDVDKLISISTNKDYYFPFKNEEKLFKEINNSN